jgi:hypothetical protein
MSAQLTSPPRRRTRVTLAVAGVIAAIAAGGVAAGQILLPDESGLAQESQYVPSRQALRALGATVAAEYRTAPGTPSLSMSPEVRQSIANQYRSR